MAQFRELGANCSGGGNLIEVNELPTENIDESKIYKVDKTETTLTPYACIEGNIMPFADIGLTYYVVNSLTDIENPPNSEEIVYIEKNTGEIYMYYDGFIKFTDAIGIPNYGIVSELPENTTDWLCCLPTENRILSVGVPNGEQNKKLYMWCNQSWYVFQMPFEIDAILNLSGTHTFKGFDNSYNRDCFVKITDSNVEVIFYTDESYWEYKKVSQNLIVMQRNDLNSSKIKSEVAPIMQRFGNCIIYPGGWMGKAADENADVDSIITDIEYYLSIVFPRDLSKCYMINENNEILALKTSTLEEWNSKIAELGITTT